ncbi:hypothetical protein [Gandjariella thermophila]|uniref:Uncharacterized protein n=1 Tax=Gandjariella thermophila TaxID=1931992 RepID=A0A4D4J5L0_9PSEU|nr:hypothetical protein [Gandjariella thermophila]GDY30754.1 hypothetical protein GTS_23870 [Gandjariella thermophila]
MRGRPPLSMAMLAVAVLLALCAAPAAATPSTTPTPTPVNPGQAPTEAPRPPGHAVGDAGTGLSLIRALPGAVPTQSIMPGESEQLPKQPLAEIGFGLASAQANSEAALGYERAVAQAEPGGAAVEGRAPTPPGAVVQTALPDNPTPTTGGINPPSSPLDALVKVGLLNGSAQARWDERTGPCVDPIADARISMASLSALNAIPSLPSNQNLSGQLGPTPRLPDPKPLVDGLNQMSGPLSQLGGLLSGKATADATGSLLSVPDTMLAHSTVRLVDLPGSANKAVRSTSTLQVAGIRLLAGTPMEIRIDVVTPPTLTVTSTGDEKTSTVDYTAPVLRVSQGGKVLGTLDAANQKLDVPIGIPIPGPNSSQLPKLPVVGGLLPNGSPAPGNLPKIDVGVLRLQNAELDIKKAAMTQPFAGFQLSAVARLLDLQLLPTDALGLPNLPSALAQVSLGEQISRAYAPTGGVVCAAAAGGVTPGGPGGYAAPPLAYTTAAYQAVPMFLTGTAMLLAGSIIVAALPSRRPRRPTP